MLKTNYILSLTLLVSIPVCAMERPPHLNNAKPAALPKVVLKTAVKPAPAVANTKSTCNVCFDDKTALDTRTLACGHKFCLDCLRSNIQTAVKDKQTQSLKCFDPKCKRPIDISDLRKIVYDKNTQNQINDIQLQEWLTQQENIKHCPTTNCHFSFVNENPEQFTHKCPDCKAEYCGKCLHKHNLTVGCTQAAQDRNLANDKDAQARANTQWLAQNTRACPKCKAVIEKNGGCNHMTCQKCHYEFCWMCMNDYRMQGHGPYGCSFPQANPLAGQAQAPQQEEQLTMENMHLIFARDPRGFINVIRDRRDLQYGITIDFAERFMRLTCEQQGQWTARIAQLLEQNRWEYLRNIYNTWNMELATFEPFTLSISNYQATGEGTFRVEITPNRAMGGRATSHVQDWIVNQNLLDMFIFDGWNCETSVDRDRLQKILNNANRYVRTQMQHREAEDRQPATQARVLEVRDNMIVSLPNTSTYLFERYANYITNFVNQNYRERYQITVRFPQPNLVHPGTIVIWDLHTHAYTTNNQWLQRLVDDAHNHFANQNR